MLFVAALQELEGKERDLVESLYEKYSKNVKVLASKIVSSNFDADDIVNDTFLKVLKYRSKFVDISEEYQAKLIIIMTYNICFNFIKKKNKIHFYLLDRYATDDEDNFKAIDIPDNVDVLDIIVRSEAIERIKDAIDQLKSPAREILTLKYFYDMRNNEIADFYDTKVSTVNSIISRGVKKLRKELGEYINESVK